MTKRAVDSDEDREPQKSGSLSKFARHAASAMAETTKWVELALGLVNFNTSALPPSDEVCTVHTFEALLVNTNT